MDAVKVLNVVVMYIKGEIDLENAINGLETFGFDKKNALKVLKDTPRDNIVKFTPPKK